MVEAFEVPLIQMSSPAGLMDGVVEELGCADREIQFKLLSEDLLGLAAQTRDIRRQTGRSRAGSLS